MKIAYLSDSLLSSGKANAIHVIKMSQALALEGHSVVLYIRAKSSSSDLKSIVSNQYGVIPLFSISAWKIPNFKGSSYLYGLLTGSPRGVRVHQSLIVVDFLVISLLTFLGSRQLSSYINLRRTFVLLGFYIFFVDCGLLLGEFVLL